MTGGCTVSSTYDMDTQISNEYCTVTQGFWGNCNGSFCNMGSKTTMMNNLLGSNGIVIGSGSNTLTFTSGQASCIMSLLPGGGPAARITGANTCSNHPGIQIQNGRINNILLSQTLTLGLNLRLSLNNLGGLKMDSPILNTAESSGCMGGVGVTHPLAGTNTSEIGRAHV